MIEELLHWDVRSRALKKLGEKIEYINKDFWIVARSLGEGCEQGIVDKSGATGLLKKIKNLIKKTEKIKINSRDKQAKFDKLVLSEFNNSLFTQKEYIEFFFTMKYNKEWGVKEFLNYAFLPIEQFQIEDEENPPVALNFLEEKLKKIKYRQHAKRKRLMQNINTYEISLNPSDFENMIDSKLLKIREIIGDYDLEMGFVTEEQLKVLEVLAEEKDLEKIKNRQKSQYGYGRFEIDIYKLTMMQLDREGEKLDKKLKNLDEKVKELDYALVITFENFCAYDSATKTIELNTDRFFFYKDKKTGKIRFYPGDVHRAAHHENFHRLQKYFSRAMPAGLKETPGEYNVSGRTIGEGVPTILEDNFMNWLEKNREKYAFSQKEIKIMKLGNIEWEGNKLARLVHSAYHREESPLERDENRDAHLRLAKIAKIPVYADDDYLPDESMPETYYFAYYFFGEKYVKETLKELECIEKRRLGSLRKTRNFLKRNEAVVLQGLLTGNWGWSTHKEFFLKHYWPKARKYCK